MKEELRIKEVLSKLGVTQVELANRLEVGVVSIKKTIAGNPTVETLQRMAKALNVPLWHFFIDPASVIEKAENNDFVAMIRFRGELYQAESIAELEKLIAEWKANQAEK